MFYKNEDTIGVKKLLFNSEGQATKSSLYEFVNASYHYDIWSIGIIAYELFTGTKIFQQNDDDHMDGEAF
jgi:serine/threonine protein kinase